MRRALIPLFLLFVGFAAPAQAVTVERVVSPGGVEAWLVQDHANPIIAVELAFTGGASVENIPGTATMVAALLDEGAGPYESQTFQGKLEDLSIGLSFETGKDSLHGHIKTLTSHRDEAFDLLHLALTQPRFDTEPVERIRGQLLAMAAQESQSPGAIASKAWFRSAFPSHAYGRPTLGDETSLKSIPVSDLRSYAKTWLARSGLKVGVVGDITPEQLKPLLDRTFGDLPRQGPAIAVAETQPQATGKTEIIARDMPQSIAIFGGIGPKRGDPDWYSAYVMNYILGGGGFSSRLTEEVREKRGLAYSVGSYLSPLDHAGMIVGSVATQNARMKDSLDLIRAEWKRMAETGPSETELADAKTYLTGSFALSQDSTSAIAGLLVAMQQENLGLDYLDRRNAYIEAVTLKDVRRVARRFLDADHLNVVVVGKPQGIPGAP